MEIGIERIHGNLGNALVVVRSQTTLFASTFHALMPPSAVPMRSYSQKERKLSIIGIFKNFKKLKTKNFQN